MSRVINKYKGGHEFSESYKRGNMIKNQTYK